MARQYKVKFRTPIRCRFYPLVASEDGRNTTTTTKTKMQPGYKFNSLTRMFSGFTSLWMMLSECRCSRAEPMSSVNLSVNSFPCPRPWFLSSSILRFPPAMNSITIASWFWMEMHSITSTILGCFASLTRQNNQEKKYALALIFVFACFKILVWRFSWCRKKTK